MRLIWKLMALNLAIVALLAAALWLFLNGAKQNQARELTQSLLDSQIGLTTQVINDTTKELSQQMTSFVYQHDRSQHASSGTLPAGFQAIALWSKSSSGSNSASAAQWQLEWVASATQTKLTESSPHSKLASLTEDELKNYFAGVTKSKLFNLGPSWGDTDEFAKQGLLVLAAPVQLSSIDSRLGSHVGILVGLVARTRLAAALSTFSGSDTHAAIETRTGVSLARSDSTSFGLRAVQLTSRVPGSNLRLTLSSRPIAPSDSLNVVHFSLMALILGLISCALCWIVGRDFSGQMESLKTFAEKLGKVDGINLRPRDHHLAKIYDALSSAFSEAKFSHNRVTTDKQTRLSNLQQFSSGLLRDIKAPLMNLLGHAALIQKKTKDKGIVEHASVIEREARRAKQAMDELANASGVEHVPHETVALGPLVENAIKSKMFDISSAGVSIKRRYQPVPRIRVQAVQVQAAIEALIQLALDSAQPSDEPKLEFAIEPRGSRVMLTISDNLRPNPMPTGIDATLARGIFRDQGGELEHTVRPSRGNDWTVSFQSDLQVAKPRSHEIASEGFI